MFSMRRSLQHPRAPRLAVGSPFEAKTAQAPGVIGRRSCASGKSAERVLAVQSSQKNHCVTSAMACASPMFAPPARIRGKHFRPSSSAFSKTSSSPLRKMLSPRHDDAHHPSGALPTVISTASSVSRTCRTVPPLWATTRSILGLCWAVMRKRKL